MIAVGLGLCWVGFIDKACQPTYHHVPITRNLLRREAGTAMNTATTTSSETTSGMAPEIQRAFASLELQEVQDIMKRLAEFNLGVCVPHMHRADLDFATLPSDLVQVEENLQVRWVTRDTLASLPNSVQVAWRWVDNGVSSAAECIKTCSRNEDTGKHFKDHL